jgi:hypothetical protein
MTKSALQNTDRNKSIKFGVIVHFATKVSVEVIKLETKVKRDRELNDCKYIECPSDHITMYHFGKAKKHTSQS